MVDVSSLPSGLQDDTHSSIPPTPSRPPSPITTSHTRLLPSPTSLLLILTRALRLRRASELLTPILPLLPLLPTRLLDLRRMSHPHESVVGLELLHGFDGVIDECEAGGLAAAVRGAQAEDVDLVFVRFVDLGEFVAEVVFGDVRAVGVKDVAGGCVSLELLRV